MSKFNTFAWFCSSIFLLASIVLWIGIVSSLITNGIALSAGLPSAMLLGTFFALPAIELWRYKRWRPFGASFRAVLVMMLDVAVVGKQPFASFWWELVAVAMALIFVFYTPLLWRLFSRKRS